MVELDWEVVRLVRKGGSVRRKNFNVFVTTFFIYGVGL